ncbi:flavodoxin domain-containing protein [Lapidilactobacillus achengensis]|uniref:Flavodoxin domain-containing protein n=1 Tax=Lapidilactobacillus achengensis TaxID=2486000 RepID=A0ABW1UQM0_9LACO|nr:flavodoxin domain-containing protein [Lapidilactobacillus achengensis]
MDKIGLIYASRTGHNEQIAQFLQQQFADLGQPTQLFNIETVKVADLERLPGFIMVSYTYHDGQIPDEALAFFDELQTADLRGKVYAVTGSGSIKHRHFGRALDYFDQLLNHLGALRATAVLKIDQDADRGDLARLTNFCQQFVDFPGIVTQAQEK